MKLNKISKKGITLTEVTITLIIIAILVAIPLPHLTKTFETTRAKQAVAVLRQIKAAQSLYGLKEGFYYPNCNGVFPCSETDPGLIRGSLKVNLDTSDPNWNVSITTTAEDIFTARAERTGGYYNSETILLDQTGQLSGSWPLPIPQE